MGSSCQQFDFSIFVHKCIKLPLYTDCSTFLKIKNVGKFFFKNAKKRVFIGKK